MDGLLLNTEQLALAAFEAAIEAHGFVFDRAAYLGVSARVMNRRVPF